MVIINCKFSTGTFSTKHIKFYNNNYIKSIEYIDNEFDDVIFKIKITLFHEQWIKYVNLEGKFHNPVGPALICYINGILNHEVHYENGKSVGRKFIYKNIP